MTTTHEARLDAFRRAFHLSQESRAELRAKVKEAAGKTDTEPTSGQREAGTYRKGKITLQGLPISIEVPRGAYRRGTSKDGKEWAIKMPFSYGYIRKTESADGEACDVFLGPEPWSELVFVVDQVRPDGTFDEPKALLGFTTAEEAEAAYLACYEPGWKGLGGLTALTIRDFRQWLEHGDTGKPVADSHQARLSLEHQPIRLAITHAPAGYTEANPLVLTTIDGKSHNYEGGNYLPTKIRNNLTVRSEKLLEAAHAAAKEKAKAEAAEKRKAAAPEALAGQVAPYQQRELTEGQMANARATYDALKAEHGPLLHERLRELIAADTKALAKPGADAERLQGRLRAYGEMLRWAEKEGAEEASLAGAAGGVAMPEPEPTAPPEPPAKEAAIVPPEPPVAPTVHKEPWQMTKREFRQTENQQKLQAIQDAIEAGKRIVLRTQYRNTELQHPESLRMRGSGEVQMVEGKGWVTLTDAQVDMLAGQAGVPPVAFEDKIYHHEVVEDALKAGKPVSPEVLAEYPELADEPPDLSASVPAVTPVKVPAGTVVPGAQPANGAALPTLTNTDIDQLPGTSYDKLAIKRAASLTYANEDAFTAAKKYIQDKLASEQRYLASMEKWRPEERAEEEPETKKAIDVLTRALAASEAHEKPAPDETDLAIQRALAGRARATEEANKLAKPGWKIVDRGGHFEIYTPTGGVIATPTMSGPAKHGNLEDAVKATWQYQEKADGGMAKTGIVPKGVTEDLKLLRQKPAPEPAKGEFSGLGAAADELQAIRNDMASAAPDDNLQERMDRVGAWIGAHAPVTPMGKRLLAEANELDNKLQGGTGNVRKGISIAEPGPVNPLPHVPGPGTPGGRDFGANALARKARLEAGAPPPSIPAPTGAQVTSQLEAEEALRKKLAEERRQGDRENMERGAARLEAHQKAVAAMQAKRAEEAAVSVHSRKATPAEIGVHNQLPWKGYASTDQGGFLAVDAGGATQEEAEVNAREKLRQRLEKRAAETPASSAPRTTPVEPPKAPKDAQTVADVEAIVRAHFATGDRSADDLVEAIDAVPRKVRKEFIEAHGLSPGMHDENADVAKLAEKFGAAPEPEAVEQQEPAPVSDRLAAHQAAVAKMRAERAANVGAPADAPAAPEPGFTGSTVGTDGKTYWFRDGIPVAGPGGAPTIEAEGPADEDVAAASGGSGAAGLHAGEPLGTGAGQAPGEPVSGTGTGTGQGPAGVPASAGVEQLAPDGAHGGAGHGSARSEGVGEGGVVPDLARGAGEHAPVGTGGGPGIAGSGSASGPDQDGANGPAAAAVAEPPSEVNPTDVAASNFRYADRDFIVRGLKSKFNANVAAVRLLRDMRLEGRTVATPEEQEVLSRYIGWGQFPALFNDHADPETDDWLHERKQFKSLISDEEYKSAKKSINNAHYTSPHVVDAHWQAAQRLGFTGRNQKFLETSAGVGYYLGMMPPELKARSKVTAVEKDQLTGSILKALYPHDNVQNVPFENYDAPPGFYDLVASNVPFGDFSVADPKYDRFKALIHDYFFLKSADLTRAGGLVMHITSPGTMDKQDPAIRKELARTCDLVAAIRFPGGAHRENAGTDVVTDMIILRKRPPGEQPVDPNVTPPEAMPPVEEATRAGEAPLFTGTTVDSLGRLYHWKDGIRVPGPDWMETVEVPDPEGGEPIVVNKYFAEHPEQMLGRLDRSGTMRAGEMKNVSMPGLDVRREIKARMEEEDRTRRTPEEERQWEESLETSQKLYMELLQAAIDRLPEDVMKPVAVSKAAFTPDVVPAPNVVKQGGYKIQNGKLYVREGGALVEQKATADQLDRIAGHLRILEARQALIDAQLSGVDPTAARERLNAVYDAYVKDHGFLTEPKNKRAFRAPDDSPNLLALENWDQATKTATKADMFTRNTTRARAHFDHADTVEDGLGISLHETGGLDPAFIAKLMGGERTAEDVGAELVQKGMAFEDPVAGWKPSDQYLSGNVRRKLVEAKAAAAADPKFAPNVAALLAVQPEDLEAGGEDGINAKIGVGWIPPSDIKAFAASLIGGRPEHFEVGYNPANGGWIAGFSDRGDKDIRKLQNTQSWGVSNQDGALVKNFAEVLHAALNNTSLVVYGGMDEREDPKTGAIIRFKAVKVDQDGKEEPAVNRKLTDDCAGKVQELKDAFKEWVWEDEERRTRLARFYNDNFNNIRNIHYNGQHLTFPGMDPNFKPHPHIPDFVWQVVTTGKGLAAHEVGMGKTSAMVMSAMELRRLGLAKKPCIACLKSNIEQITAEARKLYPGAKILSVGDKFDSKSRKRTIAQMAAGDYDLVLMTHDNMNMLKMRPQVQAGFIQEELDDLETTLVQAWRENPHQDNRIVKQLNSAKEKLEVKLKQALEGKVKENVAYFEETGIDQLFVDEAHLFKSLPVFSKMADVKGIPNQRSDRATSMLMRTRWLMEQNGGRGVVFATGTPVANTMAELYNMQRYLQPEELKERGLWAFDNWAKTFGDVRTKMEFTVSGQYKPVGRFAEFVNIPELMQIARQAIDVQRVENLPAKTGGKPPPLPSPDFTGTLVGEDGKEYQFVKGVRPGIVRPDRHDQAVLSPNTPSQQALLEDLKKRAKSLKGPPMKGADNMLVICTDGRKGSIDMRLLDPNAKDDPTNKTNQVVRNILRIAKEKPNGTQCFFSDIGVHEVAGSKHLGVKVEQREAEEPDSDEEENTEEQSDIASIAGSSTGFNLFQDVIDKLVAGGIPRDQIADFSQLKGKAKQAAQQAMRNGEVKVALGSTKKLGTGVNVQDKVVAIHHLDVPWVPADIEQRNGRGVRQGNENKDVGVYEYVTEGSLDRTFWQIVGTKARFIKQVMTPGANIARTAKNEDTEELSPEMFMAYATGDQRVLEKVNLDEEVRTLKGAADRHKREQLKLKKGVDSAQWSIKYDQDKVEKMTQDVAHLEANPAFHFKLEGGPTFTDGEKDARKNAAAAVVEKIKELDALAPAGDSFDSMMALKDYRPVVGTYKGFKITRNYGHEASSGDFTMQGPSGETYYTGGTAGSFEAVARGIAKKMATANSQIAREQTDLAAIQAKIGKPFAKAAELETKSKRAKELEDAIAATHKAKEAAAAVEETDKAEAEGEEATGAGKATRPVINQTFHANTKVAKPKPFTAPDLAEHLSENRSFDAVATAQTTGYATNGRFAFKVPEEDKAAFEGAYGSGGRPLPMTSIERLLAEPVEDEPAKVVGGKSASKEEDGQYLLESPSGKFAVVDADYFETIRQRYPNATVHLPEEQGKPVVFREGGQAIGALAPMSVTEKPGVRSVEMSLTRFAGFLASARRLQRLAAFRRSATRQPVRLSGWARLLG